MKETKKYYVIVFLIILIIKLLFFTPFEVKEKRTNKFEYHSVFFTSKDAGNEGFYSISYSKFLFEIIFIIVVIYLFHLIFDSKANMIKTSIFKLKEEKLTLFDVNLSFHDSFLSDNHANKTELLDLFFYKFGYLFPFKENIHIRNGIVKFNQNQLNEIQNLGFKDVKSIKYFSLLLCLFGFDRLLLKQNFSGIVKLILFVLYIILVFTQQFGYEIVGIDNTLLFTLFTITIVFWYLYDLLTVSNRVKKHNYIIMKFFLTSIN